MSVLFQQALSEAQESKALDVLSKVLTLVGDAKASKQRLDDLRAERAALGDAKADRAQLASDRLELDQRANDAAALQAKLDAAMTDVKARYAALEKTRQAQERREAEWVKTQADANSDLDARKAKVEAARNAVTTREIELARREKQALAGV